MPHTFVCPKCFDDEGIQEFIKENATAKRCSYCGRFGRNELAAAWRDVCKFIEECLAREYDDPDNCLGRDNESESGWAMTPTDTWDLFQDLGFGYGPQGLWDDLFSEFMDRLWIQRDPYGSLPADSWRYAWEGFSTQVKHEMRFMFFKVKTQEDYEPEPEPHTILDSLGRIIEQLELVRHLREGYSFFRARQHKETETVASVLAIGPPPRESASQSRMSPAGIPMFYGADSRQTAFDEIAEDIPARNRVTFGVFKAIRELRVLDLTHLPPPPTIFSNDEIYASRMPLIFMRRFVEDAMKPIARDGREHIDYVPTQVVSEYFRYVFRCEDGQPLDGIMYPSSRCAGGTCFTLFCNIDDCTDGAGWRSRSWKMDKPVLTLDALETKEVIFSPLAFH